MWSWLDFKGMSPSPSLMRSVCTLEAGSQHARREVEIPIRERLWEECGKD